MRFAATLFLTLLGSVLMSEAVGPVGFQVTPHPQATHAPHAESNFLSVNPMWKELSPQ